MTIRKISDFYFPVPPVKTTLLQYFTPDPGNHFAAIGFFAAGPISVVNDTLQLKTNNGEKFFSQIKLFIKTEPTMTMIKPWSKNDNTSKRHSFN